MSGIPKSIWKAYSRTQETEGRTFLVCPDLGDSSKLSPAPFDVVFEQAGTWELAKQKRTRKQAWNQLERGNWDLSETMGWTTVGAFE